MILFGDKRYSFEEVERHINSGEYEEDREFVIEALRATFLAQEGMFIASGDLETMFVNEAYEKMLGVDGRKIMGKTTPELVKGGIIERSAAEIAMRSKKQETIIQNQTNGKTVLVTATPLLDENGEVYRIVSSIRDMPVLKKMYEDLVKKEKLLEGYKQTLQVQTQKNIGEIIAQSAKMRNVIKLAEKVALNDSTVLILGESGVGKGIIARLIHTVSKRGANHVVSINCGAIPEQLLESELFGYAKGAFTGANREGKMGLIEAAEGGTVILDEIGELPISLQPKLLAYLETGEITKVGSTTSKKVDARIIAATNKNLEQMVADKTFREDLYYRLNVIPIIVPPLRERKEDIVPLVLHFLNRFNRKNGYDKTISPQMLKRLEAYDWPGNIRELRNMIERLVVLGADGEISMSDLHNEELENIQTTETKEIEFPISLPEITQEIEDMYIEKAIKEGGSIREAAKLLGITPSMLYRKINK